MAAARARAERRRGRPWALRRDPGERALRRRAAAARSVARALAPLTVTGWVLLCDRRLAGTSVTFDAVVVGPPGLLVVQARPVRGLRREPGGLVDGAGVPVSGDTAALPWATQQLVTAVAAALPGWVLAGYAALALVDPSGWTPTGTGPLALARPGQLPALAGALPASLPPLAVTDLALAVEDVCLPAEP